jgi:rubrerythrin
MSNKIIKLMQVPEPVRDISWLEQSLQAAVELELSTLPPYLCGAWSVKDTTSDVYKIVLGVALEEMGHMGLACNMLTTIGGTPQISTSVPTYPGPLPGGVSPDLTVYLAGLSIDYLQNVYMQIEYPEGGPIARAAAGETYPTIGAF